MDVLAVHLGPCRLDARRRQAVGETPTWAVKKRVKAAGEEKPQSAATPATRVDASRSSR